MPICRSWCYTWYAFSPKTPRAEARWDEKYSPYNCTQPFACEQNAVGLLEMILRDDTMRCAIFLLMKICWTPNIFLLHFASSRDVEFFKWRPAPSLRLHYLHSLKIRTHEKGQKLCLSSCLPRYSLGELMLLGENPRRIVFCVPFLFRRFPSRACRHRQISFSKQISLWI